MPTAFAFCAGSWFAHPAPLCDRLSSSESGPSCGVDACVLLPIRRMDGWVWVGRSVYGCTRTLPIYRLYENTFLQLVRSTAVILILNLLSVFENVMHACELNVETCRDAAAWSPYIPFRELDCRNSLPVLRMIEAYLRFSWLHLHNMNLTLEFNFLDIVHSWPC